MKKKRKKETGDSQQKVVKADRSRRKRERERSKGVEEKNVEAFVSG